MRAACPSSRGSHGLELSQYCDDLQRLKIVLLWNIIRISYKRRYVEKSRKGNEVRIQRWINLRRRSPSIFADHRYLPWIVTSSIASFKPGSIVLRSPSIFVDHSSSRVVDSRLIVGFPALFVALRQIAGIPALSGFPRFHRPASHCRFSRAFHRSAGSSLDIPRLLPGIFRVFDLPRPSRQSYIIIAFFCVV